MSYAVEKYRERVVEALHSMAAVEQRLADNAHPADEVSESWMHEQVAAVLLQAAAVIRDMPSE